MPEMSVMALSGPGVPSNGTPRSRARGFAAGLSCAFAGVIDQVRQIAITTTRRLTDIVLASPKIRWHTFPLRASAPVSSRTTFTESDSRFKSEKHFVARNVKHVQFARIRAER